MNTNNLSKETLEELSLRVKKAVLIVKGREGLLFDGDQKSKSGENAVHEISFFHTEDSPEMVSIHYYNKVGELVIHKASQKYLVERFAQHLINIVSDYVETINNDKAIEIFFMHSISKKLRAVFISADTEDSLITNKASAFLASLPVYTYEDLFVDTLDLFEEVLGIIETHYEKDTVKGLLS